MTGADVKRQVDEWRKEAHARWQSPDDGSSYHEGAMDAYDRVGVLLAPCVVLMPEEAAKVWAEVDITSAEVRALLTPEQE